MSDLTSEQFEKLEEDRKKDYLEVDGVYKNIAVMTIKKTANNLDAELKKSRAENLAINERLNAFEELKAKEFQEVREKAIEQARKDNNIDEQLKLEREVIADERKVILADREELNEQHAVIANDKKTSIADRLTKSAKEGFEAAFNALIKSYIVVDQKTRVRTFLNVSDGSASSITDEKDFLEYLATQDLFKGLMKGAVTTTGAGMANGGLEGSASSKNPKEMNGAERLQLKKTNPTAFFAAFPKPH